MYNPTFLFYFQTDRLLQTKNYVHIVITEAVLKINKNKDCAVWNMACTSIHWTQFAQFLNGFATLI
jgi:hypothetical protein